MILHRASTVGSLLLAAATTAMAQTPRDLVARAVEAMGGEAALRALNGVAYDYYNPSFTLGQSELPESPPRGAVSYGRVWHDQRGGRRAFIQETRQLGGTVARQRLVTSLETGVNEVGGQANPAAPGVRAAQMRVMRTSPERLLLAALDNPSALSALQPRTLRGANHDGIRLDGTDTLTIWFDRVTGLPVMHETVTDDPVLGDRATQVWMTRWQPAGRLRLPRQWDVIVNDQLTNHLYVTGVEIDPPLPDSVFAIPEAVAARIQPISVDPPPPPQVTLNQLAPFVWRVEGANYNTLVVEQPDQLVVAEMPQSTARSRATLDSLRARFPGKRIGVAVMTHYHWDHSGGIREYVAEGIPIATLEANAAFVRRVAAARRTVRPDLQSRRRRNPALRIFADSMVIGTGETRVVLYRTPTIHAEGVLSVYVPGAGVLFTSDVVNPPANAGPNTQLNAVGCTELVTLVRARGLAVSWYAGGHGALTSWTDIERAAR